MNKRLSKRQIRERQELQALGQEKGEDASLVEDEAPVDMKKEQEEDENDKDVISNSGGVAFSQVRPRNEK